VAERKLFFDVPGEGGGTRKVFKSQWLREQMGERNVATTRLSADRVARYQGKEKGASAGSARCIRVGLAELDEVLVQLCDPVVFAVLINRERVMDKERRQCTVKGTVGVGVGEIVGLQNKGEGKGQLPFLRERLFQAEETTVQVRPIAVVAVTEEGGEEGVMELQRGQYTNRQPFSFKGGRGVGLLKPSVLVREAGDRTEAVMQISLDDLKERLNLFGDEVRVVVSGGRGRQVDIPLDPNAAVVQAGGVEVDLFSEEKTSVLSCEACRWVGDLSAMKRMDMRHHAAGHAFLSDLPVSLCGYCGLDVGCSVVVREDKKLLSACSLKLANFNYSTLEGARRAALEKRLKLETEAEVAAATSLGIRRSKPRPTVQNIPIPCPVNACKDTIWKHNIIPHLLQNDHVLPVSHRTQPLRRR
jgi:hypothetical protein